MRRRDCCCSNDVSWPHGPLVLDPHVVRPPFLSLFPFKYIFCFVSVGVVTAACLARSVLKAPWF